MRSRLVTANFLSTDFSTQSTRPVESTGRREPLSESLDRLLRESDAKTVTLDDLIARTRGRGLYLVMILLSIPFITPIPLPGLSTVIGLAITGLAVRLAFQLPLRLPRFIGGRELSPLRLRNLIRSSANLLQRVEKLAKPRHGGWMEWRTARLANAILIAVMGVLLALPLPPVLPFSNSLPSWSIILLALSIMESDGILIWAAYIVVLGTSAYLFVFSGLVVAGLHHAFDKWW